MKQKNLNFIFILLIAAFIIGLVFLDPAFWDANGVKILKMFLRGIS